MEGSSSKDSTGRAGIRYEKPELRQIRLRPEEAVLGGCKGSLGSGPATADCTTPVCINIGT